MTENQGSNSQIRISALILSTYNEDVSLLLLVILQHPHYI